MYGVHLPVFRLIAGFSVAVYATVALFMLLVAASIALLVGVWLVSSV